MLCRQPTFEFFDMKLNFIASMQFYKNQHGYSPLASISYGIVVDKKAFPGYVSVGFVCVDMIESLYQKLVYERPSQMTITYSILSLFLQVM